MRQQRRRLPGLAGYSRYVVFMKFLLPAAALMLVAAIIVWPQIHVADNNFSIGLSDFQLTARENPSMVNARFVGSDKKSQPFSITADLAKNLLLGKSKIELEMPKGRHYRQRRQLDGPHGEYRDIQSIRQNTEPRRLGQSFPRFWIRV